MKIKQMLCIAVAFAFAGMALAAKMTLTEARAEIGKCIANPAKMTSVVKQLSAQDQIAFLAEVNRAISEMPGSPESKAATYLDVNRAAVRAADAGNKTAMIAEVFATVPLEVLTVINERFAVELLNRENGSSKSISDEQYMKVAQNIMNKVNERCASAENAAVRSAFALLMLVRADNGKMADLPEALIKMLPKEAQNDARGEWIPAALAQNQTKTYEPMLGSAGLDVTDMAANDVVIRLVGPQLLESMLAQIVEGVPLINNSDNPEVTADGARDADPAPQPSADPEKDKPEPDEPVPYQDQIR